MNERERPDLDAVAKRFEEDEKKVMSDEGRSMRRSEDRRKDARRKGTIKRGLKKTAVVTGIGIAGAAGGREVLQNIDGKPLGSLAQPPEKRIRAQAQGHIEDTRIQEAIERAKVSAEVGKPAPQSGVIEVSEAGTTGYVDLDNPNPEDTTGVTQPTETETGGMAAEQEPDTGGLPAEGSTTQ